MDVLLEEVDRLHTVVVDHQDVVDLLPIEDQEVLHLIEEDSHLEIDLLHIGEVVLHIEADLQFVVDHHIEDDLEEEVEVVEDIDHHQDMDIEIDLQ